MIPIKLKKLSLIVINLSQFTREINDNFDGLTYMACVFTN